MDPPNAPVTVVEYGDHDRPYRGMAQSVVKELVRRQGANMRYVWRHLAAHEYAPRVYGRRHHTAPR